MYIEGLGRLSLVNLPICRCCDTSEFGHGKLETLFRGLRTIQRGYTSLMVHLPCLGACYANIALALSNFTRPPGDAVPACLNVVSANGTRSTSRFPLCKHRQVPLMPAERLTIYGARIHTSSVLAVMCSLSVVSRSFACTRLLCTTHTHARGLLRPPARPLGLPLPRAQQHHHCTLLCAHCSVPQLFLLLPPPLLLPMLLP